MLRLIPLLLLACNGGDKGAVSPGSTGGAGSGDDGGGDDTGGSGTGGDDTGEDPVDWQTLPTDCTLPTADGDDQFVLVGSEKNTEDGGPSWFTEIIDIAYLPDEDLVLTSGQGGLVTFGVGDPSSPTTEGYVAGNDGPFQRYYNVLPAEPGLAWATNRESGFDVISVEDPQTPEVLVHIESFGFEGMARSGDLLYVVNLYGTLEVFDVSEPSSPETTGAMNDLGRPWAIAIEGDVAYVADGSLGLVTLDLSSPEHPSIVGSLESAGQPMRLTIDDGYVYVATGAGGLEIYEVSDPLAPSLVTTVDVGGSAQDVDVHDGLAAVTTQEAVVLLDVGRAGTPEDPQPFAYEETEQFAMTVDGEGDYFAVGDWNILGLWEAGTGEAPAADLSHDIVAFLEEAETREVSVLNRGNGTLDLAGIEPPEGVTVEVSAVSLAPGESARVALHWDGETELDVTSLCIATDDPSSPDLTLVLTSGASGEGKVIGQQAPDFTLMDLDGNLHTLSDQLGHPVVLAYFATW